MNDVQKVLPANYTIDSYLDQGGQGTVFRGLFDGAPAAIKVFAPAAEPRRVERELSLLKAISCPTLVKMLDTTAIAVGGVPHFVVAYEYLHGGDLRRPIADPSTVATAFDIACVANCVRDAIHALWAKRIVHRDIKPANIMCASLDRYVLVDVGLARHVDRSDITGPGLVAGTVPYMSPEQLRGQRALTQSSDFFSLGVTLYELATKQHPFGRRPYTPTTTVMPVRSSRPDLPISLCNLIQDLMQRAPARRPADFEVRL